MYSNSPELTTEADNSSQVYHAFNTTTHISYTVKCVRNAAPGSPRAADVQRELDLPQSVAAQRGVTTLNFSSVDNPWASGDNEYLFLVLNPAALERATSATRFCSMYHRDLRPRNVWCNAEGDSLRIANFEKATRKEQSVDFRCRNLAYMSSECADSTGAGPSCFPRESDIWALAVILFNIVTGN